MKNTRPAMREVALLEKNCNLRRIKMKKKYFVYLLFAVIPLLLLSIHIYFIGTVDDAQRPVNTDPDYAYLISAIDLSKLGTSKMVLHPGTTFQVLAHLVMKAAYYFSPRAGNDFRSSVLKHPGYYLNVLQAVFSFLNILLVLAVGIVTYQVTRKITAALLIQSTPFFSSQVLIFGLRKVTTDILLISVLLVMVIVLVKRLHAEPPATGKGKTYLYPIGLGVLTGFALATKVTFLTTGIVFIIILPSIRARVIYLLSAAGGTVLFTLPIVSQYTVIYRFITRIFTHKGIYGNGAASIFDWHEYTANLLKILLGNLPFFLLLVFSILFIITVYIKERREKTGESIFKRMPGRMLAAVSLAQILGIILVARHFKSKYLLPVLCFSALMIYLLYLLSRENPSGKSLPILSHKWMYPAALLFILFSFIHTLCGLSRYHQVQADRLRESLSIGEKLSGEYKEYCVIYYYNASSIIFGLEFGNKWTPGYRKPLFEIYGERYFYNHRNPSIFTWSGRRVTIEELKTLYRDKIIFYGNTLAALHEKQRTPLPPFPLRDVFGGRYFTLYRIVDK
jgi:hypothetical protein